MSVGISGVSAIGSCFTSPRASEGKDEEVEEEEEEFSRVLPCAWETP